MLVFDAHLDLAMNAVEWNRDLSQPLAHLRAREAHKRDKPDRGRGTVSFDEMRRAGIGLCVATQIARVEHDAYSPVAGWASPAQAWAMTRAQRAWYDAMEEAGEIRILRNLHDLDQHLALWSSPVPVPSPAVHPKGGRVAEGAGDRPTLGARPSPAAPAAPDRRPIGCILSLEGADSLVTLQHLERSWNDGLRAVGPAHYGPGVYAQGTSTTGGFNARGRDLLREMQRLGILLDVTHLSDECLVEALDLFDGPVWASHHLCRALVPHQRQLPDEHLRLLAQRDAVVGLAIDAWMVVPGWVRGQSTPESTGASLRHVAEHADHIAQVTGSARHVGIGTDLDGAFGNEQTPLEVQSIADILQLADHLRARGWSQPDIEGVFSGNFLRVLRRAWSGT